MKYIVMMGLCWMQIALPGAVWAQQQGGTLSRPDFYSAMAGKDEDAVNKQLLVVKAADLEQKAGFEGALLMKLAGIVKGLKKKLDLFKDGHEKLESVLEKDSLNAELRFLRLMIQEHSPGILGYKGDMDADKRFIQKNYKKLPTAVQQAVVDYSTKSKVLTSL